MLNEYEVSVLQETRDILNEFGNTPKGQKLLRGLADRMKSRAAALGSKHSKGFAYDQRNSEFSSFSRDALAKRSSEAHKKLGLITHVDKSLSKHTGSAPGTYSNLVANKYKEHLMRKNTGSVIGDKIGSAINKTSSGVKNAFGNIASKILG